MGLRLLIGSGAEPGTVAFLLAFALTYLVHSVLWVAASAVLVRVRAPAWSTRHTYWKLALFGPLLSALLASAAAGGFGHNAGSSSYVREVTVPALTAESAPADRSPATVAAASDLQARFGSAKRRACLAVVALGQGAAALGLLRFVGSALLLMSRLRSRTRIADPRLLRRLERMRARLGSRQIVLTESTEVGSPLVIGTGEICVPQALLTELSDAEIDTVLAHELAHVERGDGIWFAVAGLVQSMFWLHPLTHWVSSRFRYSAELACDDRAVELTRNPLGLARALVQVAASASGARRLALAPTMARPGSALLPRVRRLTGPSAVIDRQARGHGSRWGIAVLVALGAALGGFSVRLAQARSAQQAAAGPAQHRSADLAHSVHNASRPNAEQQSTRMAALAQLEQQLSSQLEAAKQRSDADQEGSPTSVQVLELSQKLRHVRETEAWLEGVFADEWAAWENKG